jgi:Spy/CpxP family protein refolding chaperone
MKIRKSFVLALTLATVLGGSIAFAQTAENQGASPAPQQGMHWHGRHGGDHMFGIMSKLNLTDAQKAQIKQIHENHKATMASLHQQLKAQSQATRQSMQSGSFDQAAVTQNLIQTAPLRAQLMGERAKMHQEMLNVLTPDQKAQLEQMKSQFKARREQFRARHQQNSSQVE